MNKKNTPTIGHNKKKLLNKTVEHIDITSFDSRKIIESMKKMSFTSRDTANAAGIFNEMILEQKKILTYSIDPKKYHSFMSSEKVKEFEKTNL